MIGALIGDIVGSRFERNNNKSKQFKFFEKSCRPTDDSIMSLAVARAIMNCDGTYDDISQYAISSMQELGRKYINAGYGGNFIKWIQMENPQPYNSFGNGSAMRVSPCGYAANSLEEARVLSHKVSEVSHNHPEGIKGAEAISTAILLARQGKTKDIIRAYIEENYYSIDFTIDKIRKNYKFDVSCQGSVPVALEAFFESKDFIDAIRIAVSVGGDSDTIACMAGSVAEAFYGVPEKTIREAIEYLDSYQMEILYYFEKKYPSKVADKPGITIFDILDAAVDKIIPEGATIEYEDLPDGNSAILVDENDMIPDFSSFDEKEEDSEKSKKQDQKAQKEKQKKHATLDESLSKAITDYNDAYTQLNDHGIRLFNQRERSVDLLGHVECLVNSIANKPKEFDTVIAQIQTNKKKFNDTCHFAQKELEAARKSAFDAGAGVAGGAAVVSLAPSAAMWIATTFGTASTGTAISTLSGAAATKAALAWIGGGALAAGGGGVAAGNALLALAGPIGWGIAGASILTSILLFRNKKLKLEKEKKDEIKSIASNTESVKETDAKVDNMLKQNVDLRREVNKQYQDALVYFNMDYRSIPEEGQLLLGALVNNAKALAASLSKEV